MSKMSSKEDDCAFTWKLFTGWDFMIGHAETALNKVPSRLQLAKTAMKLKEIAVLCLAEEKVVHMIFSNSLEC